MHHNLDSYHSRRFPWLDLISIVVLALLCASVVGIVCLAI